MAALGSGREVQFRLQIALRSNERNCLTFLNKSQIPIPGTGIKRWRIMVGVSAAWDEQRVVAGAGFSGSAWSAAP